MIMGAFCGIISDIAEALFAEREMNVFHFSGIFSAFSFWFADGEISFKTNNTNILGDGKVSVLWHNMRKLVNFTRHIKSTIDLCFVQTKYGHCSEQYSARRRGQKLF